MKIKKIISTGKALAIAIIVLGAIHGAATFSPLMSDGLLCLDKGKMNAMLYMSLIAGASLILSGIILLMLFNHVENHKFLTSSILVIGVFLALNGVLAVCLMKENPFAWLAYFINTFMLLITIFLKTNFKTIQL